MRHRAIWDRTDDETRADLERAQRQSEAIIALSSYGPEGGARHATVWSASVSAAAAQRFEAGVPPGLAAGVLARHARDGFHPALVGMSGSAERPVLAFVLARGASAVTPPRFVAPQPFRGEDGALFVTRLAGDSGRDDGFLTSLAAVGAPRDARGTGLLVAGIWSPQPPVRVAWSVHLDAVPEGAWRDLGEPRVLETAARPVLALPLDGGGRWVLSLWHDRVSEPWPEPDPFAPARRFEAREADDSAALAEVIASLAAREDRRVVALGAAPSSGRFLALFGSVGTEELLPRRFTAAGPGAAAPSAAVEPDHPLDRWAHEHMRKTGARHAQVVVVRGRRLAFARAYTFAEAGYPAATLDDALRLGSVSKALTAMALLPALAARGRDVEARAAALLGFAPGEGPPRFAEVTVRHLLAHDAGLRSFADLRPDEPRNLLSEHAITARLDGAAAPARPGQLSLGLRALRDDAVLARAPGGGGARLGYSNEGFVLLGEILATLERGSPGAYEEAVVDALLRRAGVDPGERGCLFGAGRAAARARRESPAHPASPTWAAKRFAGDDLDASPLVLAPYADNGPFLGGAAGWSVPLVWLARVLAALGPRPDGSGLWRREDLAIAAAPAAPGARHGHGFHLGEPGFWTRRGRGGSLETIRVLRLHHNGRLDGGSALLIHQIPHDPRDDALDAALSVAVAFNQLGPLYEEPHGRELLAILRQLELAPGSAAWASADVFGLVALSTLDANDP